MYYNGKKLLSLDELNTFDSKAYALEKKGRVVKIFVDEVLSDIQEILKTEWHNIKKGKTIYLTKSKWSLDAFNVVKELYKSEGILLNYNPCLKWLKVSIIEK